MEYPLVRALAALDERTALFLIITDALLGLLVLVFFLLVVRYLLREIRYRRRARAMSLTSTGLTMADGGEETRSESTFVGSEGILRKKPDKGNGAPRAS